MAQGNHATMIKHNHCNEATQWLIDPELIFPILFHAAVRDRDYASKCRSVARSTSVYKLPRHLGLCVLHIYTSVYE